MLSFFELNAILEVSQCWKKSIHLYYPAMHECLEFYYCSNKWENS